MAWNIGAHDVSNAMGTSVGSKAITLKQAILLASILEFSGAFFLGSTVTETIQKGIINPEFFSLNPHTFVLGMMSALIATAVLIHIASYIQLPISTTHALVGGVLGFGLIVGGSEAIHWSKVLSIGLSWIFVPFVSGFIAFNFFHIIQKKILFMHDPIKATKQSIPFLVFLVFSFFSFAFLFKGFKQHNLHLSLWQAISIALMVGFFISILSYFLAKKIPELPKEKQLPHTPQHVISLEKAAKHLERTKLGTEGELKEEAENLLEKIRTLTTSIKGKTETFQKTTEYQKVEKSFGYLQIISASMVAVAHGSNDVANAIGPVAAVITTLKATSALPQWLLFFGGIGMVLGLATWGYRIMQTIGEKITILTPTRGFSAEFAAAITILSASKLGLPVSSTHALVGAVLGVGMARGFSSLNMKVIRSIFLSWMATIPLSALFCIVFYYLLKLIF
jgi:phosphate/sulfate permease